MKLLYMLSTLALLIAFSACVKSTDTASTKCAITPPAWIQGTWTDTATTSIQWEFSENGATKTENGNEIEYCFNGLGLVLFSERIEADTAYALHWTLGQLNAFDSFEKISPTQMKYCRKPLPLRFCVHPVDEIIKPEDMILDKYTAEMIELIS